MHDDYFNNIFHNFIFLAWIFFVPFRFYIDTTVNQYYYLWSGLIKVSLIPDEVESFFAEYDAAARYK